MTHQSELASPKPGGNRGFFAEFERAMIVERINSGPLLAKLPRGIMDNDRQARGRAEVWQLCPRDVRFPTCHLAVMVTAKIVGLSICLPIRKSGH